MAKEPSVHPFPLLFDLAANLVSDVSGEPTSSRNVSWPVDNNQEEFRFKGDIGKVRASLRDIASPSRTTAQPQCYLAEYTLGLMFHRFFSWAAWEAARGTELGEQEASFQYIDRFANARAVLGMPLGVQLLEDMQVTIPNGNFGYEPSKDAPWIYPHLDNYLSSFYYPWFPEIPQKERKVFHAQGIITGNPFEAALKRITLRSELVCRELWAILRRSSDLRLSRQDDGVPIPLDKLQDRLDRKFTADSSFAFIRCAILSKGLGLGCVWDHSRRSSRDYHAVEKDDFLKAYPQICGEVNELKVVDQATNEEFFKRFIADVDQDPGFWLKDICQNGFNSDEPEIELLPQEKLQGMLLGSSGVDYLAWRLLEERLRLLVDCLFLLQRREDPPVFARYHGPQKFAFRGMNVVEVPEIRFNLWIEGISEHPEHHIQRPLGHEQADEKCKAWELANPQCQAWLQQARADWKNCGGQFGKKWDYPQHALFVTLLEGEPDSAPVENKCFVAALLAAQIISTDEVDGRTLRNKRKCLQRIVSALCNAQFD